MKHLNDIIEDSFGYYTREFTLEPFEGEIIKLSADEANVLFQRYWEGDEHSFREFLTGRDDWYQTMPYNLWKDNKWMEQTTRYLNKRKDNA